MTVICYKSKLDRQIEQYTTDPCKDTYSKVQGSRLPQPDFRISVYIRINIHLLLSREIGIVVGVVETGEVDGRGMSSAEEDA